MATKKQTTKRQVKEAIREAMEHGPRNEEELLEHAVLELKGQEWVDAATEEEWEAEAEAIRKVSAELGLDIKTGQQAEPPKAKQPKPKAKAEPEPPELHPCICGCGKMVKGRYAQGHDAKVHSWIGQVEKGEMTEENLQAKGVDVSTFVACTCCGKLIDPHPTGMGPACRAGRCACKNAA